MDNDLQRTEGVVLQATVFRDYDKILSVFSREEGLIKFIVNGANRNSKQRTAAEPLTCAEFIYTTGRGEICTCREVSIVNPYFSLRNSYACLQAAGDLIQILQQSQVLGRAAPLVYQLLIFYLDKMPQVKDPNILSSSFRLKVLKHDGLLGIANSCTTCGTILEGCNVHLGESYCLQHAPLGSLSFSSEEMQILCHLADSQSFPHLIQAPLSQALHAKLQRFFTEQLHL